MSKTAIVIDVRGNRASVMSDGATVIKGLQIIGDASKVKPGATVYIQDVDNTRVIVAAGASKFSNLGAEDPFSTNNSLSWHANMSQEYLHPPAVHDIVEYHTHGAMSSGMVVMAVSTTEFDVRNLLHAELGEINSDQHVPHSTVSIIAGDGLTGGGNIAANRTLSVNLDDNGALEFNTGALRIKLPTNNGLSRTSSGLALGTPSTSTTTSTNSVTTSTHAHALDLSGRTLTAGAGLTGGGTLGADRTFAVGAGDGIDVAADAVAVDVTDIIDTAYGLTEDTNNIRINLASPSGLVFSAGALMIDDAVAGAGITVINKVLSIGQGDGILVSTDGVAVRLATTSGLMFSSGQLMVDDTIAGFGLTISSKVLAVGQGEGITVNTNTVSVTWATATPTDVSLVASAIGTGVRSAREDHRHVLNQGISPTWTGGHTFNTNITLADNVALGKFTGGNVCRIYPYRSGFTALDSDIGYDTGTSIESDGVIAFIETDNNVVRGWFDVNTPLLHLKSGIRLWTNNSITWRDSALKAYSSTDGQLDIDADVELELTAPTVQVNVTTRLDVVGNVRVDGDLQFVGSQSITTTADALTLAPTGDLYLTPGGNDVLVTWGSGKSLTSSNYVSQTTGWGISYGLTGGHADFRSGYFDELHVKAFIADIYSALAGGLVITKSRTRLSRNFTIPNTGVAAYLYVEDLEGFEGYQVFVANDYVLLRVIDTSGGGLVVQNVWGRVTAYLDLTGGEQRWTFTTTTPAYSAANVIYKGAVALDYGQTGSGSRGVWEATVLDAAGSPYSQVQTWSTVANGGPANFTTHVRLGNLDGLAGIGLEYGLWAGQGTDVDDAYIIMSDASADLHNVTLTVRDATNTRIIISPSQYIGVGVTAPTAYLGADGFWVGNSSGTYKLHIGDIDGERLVWDGSAMALYASTGNYISLNGTAINLYSNGASTMSFDGTTGDARFGEYAAGKFNLYWDASEGDLLLRRYNQVRIKLDGGADSITIGNTGSNNVVIDSTSFKVKQASVVLTDISNNGALFFDSTGTSSVSILNSGQITIGDHSYVLSTVEINGPSMVLYSGGNPRLLFDAVGKFWAGDSSWTERIQWDTGNGLVIYNANNQPVFSSNPSGTTWLSNLAVSSGLGDSLFSNNDGLLLLGPGGKQTPTEWQGTRGQAATLTGAFHQASGRWPGTRAVLVEAGTTNYATNPRPDASGSTWNATNGTFSFVTASGPFVGSTVGQIVATGGANLKIGQLIGRALVAGEVWAISFWCKANVAGDAMVVCWQRSTSPYDPLSNQVAITPTTEWAYYTALLTVTESANGQLLLSSIATDNTVQVANVQAEIAPAATSYCDGSMGAGYSWSGAPHQSTSVRTTNQINLDGSIGLISARDTMSFATWVQMPYASNATWYSKNNCVMDVYGSAGGRLLIRFDAPNSRFGVYINGSWAYGSALTFSAGDWLHLVFTVDYASDGYRLYVNGQLAVQSAVAKVATVLEQWNIGTSYVGTYHTGFAFSEYAVFGRVLTAEEVAGLYASGKPLTDMGATSKPGIFILDGEFDLRSSVTGARVQLDLNGIHAYSSTSVQTVGIEVDGDAFFGSNISAPATTSLAVFANAQTYNSESLGAGDVLLGDNSAGKFNLLWDVSEGDLLLRRGTAARITLDASTDSILIGQAAASQNNILISSGAISIRNNTTERIGVTAAGILTIKDSGGNAVFTFNSSAGAEFTKPLTIASTGGIYQGTGTFASPTTGLKIWNESGYGRIAGYNGGYPQWYADTDGKLYAADGDVVIGSNGIAIQKMLGAYDAGLIFPMTTNFATCMALFAPSMYLEDFVLRHDVPTMFSDGGGIRLQVKLNHVEKNEFYLDQYGATLTAGYVQGPKYMVTPLGGYAIKLVAATQLYEGEIVCVGGSNGLAWKTATSGIYNGTPVGVVYANAASGTNVWVVTRGIAYVLPESGLTATVGYIILTSTSSDGRATQTNTLGDIATHWRRVGHWLDSGTGNGVKTRAVISC